MVAPVRLVIISSASWDGVLPCLKYEVSQLLNASVDVLATVKVEFSAQSVFL